MSNSLDNNVSSLLFTKRAIKLKAAKVVRQPIPVKKILRPNKKATSTPNVSETSFPELDTEKGDDKAYEVFSPILDDFRLFARATANLAVYLRAMTSTQAFGSGAYTHAISNGKKEITETYDKTVDELETIAGQSGFTPNLKLENGNYKVYLKPVNIPFSISLGNNEDYGKITDVFKQIFKNFTFPTAWEKQQEPSYTSVKVSVPDYTTGDQLYSFFENLEIEDKGFENKYVPEKFVTPKLPGQGKAFAKYFRFEVSLGDMVIFSSYMASSADQKGTLAGIKGLQISGQLTIKASALIPLKMAAWMTSVSSLQDLVIKLFYDHLNLLMLYATATKKMSDPGISTMSMAKVQQQVELRKKEIGFEPKPKTNAEGFCILRTGRVVYIPTVDNTVPYTQALQSGYDQETGTVKPNNQIPEIKSKAVYTDWFNELFAHTSEDGSLQTINLSGVIPLDQVTIARYLNRSMFELFGPMNSENDDVNKNRQNALTMFLDTTHNLATELDVYPKDGDSVTRNYKMLFTYLADEKTTGEDSSIAQMLDAGNKELSENAIKRAQTFVDINRQIANKIEQTKKYTIITIIYNKFYYTLFGIYSQQSDSFRQAFSEAIRKNSISPNKIGDISVANMPGLKFMLPHQAEAFTQTELLPDGVVDSIAPGGGKCLVGNTLVPTNQGLLTLREIWQDTNEPVIDGLKNTKDLSIVTKQGITRVDKVYRRKANKKFRVTMSDGTIITGLPQHRLWVRKDFNDYDYVRLDEIKPNMLLQKQLGTNLFGNKSELTQFWPDYYKNSVDRRLRLPLHITTEFATLLGLLVAEGNFQSTNIVFTNHHKIIRKLFRRYYRKTFAVKPFNQKNKVNILSHKEVSDFIRNIIGGKLYSDQQTIPKIIRQSGKAMQIAFLRGLFEGDGSIYKQNKGNESSPVWLFEYCSISKTLAYQLKYVLDNLGIASIVKSKGEKYKSKLGTGKTGKLHQAYVVYVEYRNHRELAEIGFLSKRKNSLLKASIDHLDWLNNEAVQNTNLNACGTFNRLPIGDSMHVFTEKVRELISTYNYEVTAGTGIATKTYSLQKLWREANMANIASDKYDKGNPFIRKDTSTHMLNNFTTMLADSPLEIRNSVYTKFKTELEDINKLILNTWVYPIKMEWV